jgi:polyisoprenoid-binding protein YceI
MLLYIKQLVIALSLLTLGGAALAATILPENPDVCEPFMDGRVDESLLSGMLSAAEDGHLYRIQPGSSQVGFCVNSALKRIEGNFTEFKGGITLGNGEANNGQTLVLIRTDSLDTQGALVRSLLKGESFFDVEKYPDVLFVSNSFEWTGADTAIMKGDLTLRGITRPILFEVTLTPAKTGMITVKATATINRAEFGMDKLDSIVNGEVQLCLSVEALKFERISAANTTGDGKS